MWRLLKSPLTAQRAGLLMALAITSVVTDFVKVLVGEPRPDFFWRCWPDGNVSYVGNAVNCTGNPSDVREGRKSFPSGHASSTPCPRPGCTAAVMGVYSADTLAPYARAVSFCSMTYLALFVAGKLHTFDGRAYLWKFVVFLAPYLLCVYVAITRLENYMHHWQDVTVGAVLGMLALRPTACRDLDAADRAARARAMHAGTFVAAGIYRQYYPSLFAAHSEQPSRTRFIDLDGGVPAPDDDRSARLSLLGAVRQPAEPSRGDDVGKDDTAIFVAGERGPRGQRSASDSEQP